MYKELNLTSTINCVLYNLGSLNEKGFLIKLAKKIEYFLLDLLLSKMLLINKNLSCTNKILTIISIYKLDIVNTNNNFTRIRKTITSCFFLYAIRKDLQESYQILVESQPIYIHPIITSIKMNKKN
uniref:Uncharacterized protein n=1 Tax=Physcomitrium patens TaxID=3218 RepID=A0A2K1JVQ1_PHYPA|nr:hypothetical protein PHYPA_015376 [Physcomitrium patens]